MTENTLHPSSFSIFFPPRSSLINDGSSLYPAPILFQTLQNIQPTIEGNDAFKDTTINSVDLNRAVIIFCGLSTNLQNGNAYAMAFFTSSTNVRFQRSAPTLASFTTGNLSIAEFPAGQIKSCQSYEGYIPSYTNYVDVTINEINVSKTILLLNGFIFYEGPLFPSLLSIRHFLLSSTTIRILRHENTLVQPITAKGISLECY